ncbi:hypothetical protein ABTW96_24275 [Nocardia beijingensis]|uniref:hypothetical protein n=1 Tax=Nocardia beijingensis TaxID=95162 RepID=UPI0033300B22
MAGGAGELRADSDSVRATAGQVDQVIADVAQWWESLTNGAAGCEATLSKCTTRVGSGFFNGANGDNGYSANKRDLESFVDTVGEVLAKFSHNLHVASGHLNEMTKQNVEEFRRTLEHWADE